MNEENKKVSLDEIREAYQKGLEAQKDYFEKLLNECDYDTKLAVTAWVFKNIVEHAEDGGSYRYLIYERLGFGPDAYVPLYEAGGMTISNEFDLDNKDEIINHIIEHKIESMKKLVGLCDEPGCFEHAGSGWPSDSGYRWTCSKHYDGKLKRKEDE